MLYNQFIKPVIVILFLSVTSVFTQSDLQNVRENISVERIKRHMHFLGSDLFEGRATGSIGASLAAKYLAIRFEEYGLTPVGSGYTYYQYVPMHSNKPNENSILTLNTNEVVKELQLNEDYLIYGAGDRSFIPSETEMVFVGYGIIAPEFDYNDYAGIDIEGKIAVMFEGEPYSEADDYFNGENNSVYSYSGSKQRIALSRGAIGTVIIPHYDNNNWENKQREFYFEDVYLAYSVNTGLNIMLNPKFLPDLFAASKFTGDEVVNNIKKGLVESFPLNTTLVFKGSFKRRDFVGQNVVGLVKSYNEEYDQNPIIITAHYDHLGIGLPVEGDSIYNGVFDNAIGCAVLLELAKLTGENRSRLMRPVLFLLVTGEEKGLLGSRYYLDQPLFPLYKTVANINIDGVPFIDEFDSIIPFGYNLSTLKNSIDRVAGKLNLSIEEIPELFSNSETFNRSDQIAFANAGIPAVLIMDGTDYKNISTETGMNKLIEYANSIYHTPFDDLSQSVNYNAVEQYVELLYRFILDISNSEDEPEWFSGVPYRSARLRTKAERR